MAVWDVRWYAPQENSTITKISRMPLAKRPAVVLPIQSSVAEACAKIRHLTCSFPEIHITIRSEPNYQRIYAREVLQYARRGFNTVHGDQVVRTLFGVNANGNWTPEQAYQILGMVHLAAAGRGEVEQPFPEDLPQRDNAINSREGGAWQAVMDAYRRNGLRVYAQFTHDQNTDVTSALERFLQFADGLVLSDSTQVEPTSAYDLKPRWIGTVNEKYAQQK